MLDLSELDGLRFEGEKAARPFLRVLAGTLLRSSARGIVGSHDAIARMLGAFGGPVGETCVRRALAGLEAAGLISAEHDFQRHPKERPFISKRDRQRPARTITERGRIITAGPVLNDLLLRLRADSASRRKKQGCPKKTTHSDLLPKAEVKKHYARARETQPLPKTQPAASPPKVSAPSAPTNISNAPSALPEKAAFRKGEGRHLANFTAKAPPSSADATSPPPDSTPVPPHPNAPERKWRRVWVATEVEEKLIEFSTKNRKPRAAVMADALAAYLGTSFGPPKLVASRPKTPAWVAPQLPLHTPTVDLSLAILKGRFSATQVATLAQLLDDGRLDLVEAAIADPEKIPASLGDFVEEATSAESPAAIAHASALLFEARTAGKLSAASADVFLQRIEDGELTEVLRELEAVWKT